MENTSRTAPSLPPVNKLAPGDTPCYSPPSYMENTSRTAPSYLENTSRTAPSLPPDVAKLPLNLDDVEDAPRTPTLVWDAKACTFTPKFTITDKPAPSSPPLPTARMAVQLEAQRLTAEFKAKEQRLNKPQARPKKSRCGQKCCHWCVQEATDTATATATATTAATTSIPV